MDLREALDGIGAVLKRVRVFTRFPGPLFRLQVVRLHCHCGVLQVVSRSTLTPVRNVEVGVCPDCGGVVPGLIIEGTGAYAYNTCSYTPVQDGTMYERHGVAQVGEYTILLYGPPRTKRKVARKTSSP